jgi:Tol biopolymer transport system component
VSISPEGNHVAFIGTNNGIRQLYLRALNSSEATPMAGTERAYCTPTFSPDGQWLAFFDPGVGELKKISIQGGPVSTLVKAGGIFGATWGADDSIIYSDSASAGLRRISSAGGTPMSITQVDASKGETAHRWPAFLPGGKAFVFAIEKGKSPDDSQIAAQRLDTGERRVLVQGGTYPHHVPAGYLAYIQGGRLMAVPFDVGRLQVRGQAFAVSEAVQESGSGASQYGLSSDGSLVYVPPSAAKTQWRLIWVSRDGSEQPLGAPLRNYGSARLSPDGRRVAVEADDQIWLYDLSRDTLTRFTFEGAANGDPIWTPDGKRVAFSSDGNIVWQLADGSGGLERLTNGNFAHIPFSFSPDAQLLAFQENNPTTGKDLWVLRLSDRKAQPFVRTSFAEGGPAFSPDGRWLAYASDESGRPEIYVQPYPGPGDKWQISTEGGNEVMWNRNGIYYRSGNKMMAVEVTTQPTFSAGKPRMLFEGQYLRNEWPQTGPIYDVSPNGQRFLMAKPSGEALSARQVNVVLNWFEELKQKVPAGEK